MPYWKYILYNHTLNLFISLFHYFSACEFRDAFAQKDRDAREKREGIEERKMARQAAKEAKEAAKEARVKGKATNGQKVKSSRGKRGIFLSKCILNMCVHMCCLLLLLY